eukprot:14463265-Alexandrium_andersonii.AAC.1
MDATANTRDQPYSHLIDSQKLRPSQRLARSLSQSLTGTSAAHVPYWHPSYVLLQWLCSASRVPH